MARLEDNDRYQVRHHITPPVVKIIEETIGESCKAQGSPPFGLKILAIFAVEITLIMMSCLTPILARAYLAPDHQRQQESQRVSGQKVALLEAHQPLHPTSPAMVMELSFALKLRDEPALDALLANQNNPASPLYHHYLTLRAFNDRFAPGADSVAVVVAYAHRQGFQVTSVSSNRILVHVKATVASVNHAFAVTINDYRLGSRVVYAPSDNPLLPLTVAARINTITGLNSVGRYHPVSLHRNLKPLYPRKGPKGGYTPDELRTAYNVKPLLAAGMDGMGQTIAVFELDGYLPEDVAFYRQYYHLGPLKASNVLVDGATATPSEFAIEATMNMEVISAMAPGATQQVYIGPNTLTGITDTYNRIVTDDTAKVVSTGWGECELSLTSSYMDALNTIFKQGAAQGQSFFAASGNLGAYDCTVNAIQTLAVDSPANNPYVVGVGGTTLNTGPDGSYGSESAWGNLFSGPNHTAVGSGGGKSIHFLRPAYQSGRNLTDSARMLPDVSANADPDTGYAIYHTGGSLSNPGWTVLGGTDAAAPLWASIIIDINQFLLSKHIFPVGSASVALYQLYNMPQLYPPYHDITSGTNLYYVATPGYDMATGLGTPDVWNMARDLVSAPQLPTQMLQNAGFESEAAGWKETSRGGYQLISTANPHSGRYSAYFCNYANCLDSIAQATLLPKFIRQVTLSYWIFSGRSGQSPNCQNNLQVLLRTEKGELITTAQKLCNPVTNGWIQYSFDVTNALLKYAGQTIQLVFETSSSNAPRSNFFVYLDDVEFRSLTVAAGGTTAQFMKNPGFEVGQAPWKETSKGGYQLISTANPHNGKYSAYLCGYPNCDDTISQTITLPTATHDAALSYWFFLGRTDTNTSCHDAFKFSVNLLTAQGKPITNLQTLCNTAATGWSQYSFNVMTALTPYLGQQVQVVFRTTGSTAKRANFFVDLDDVALYATYS
ncbi:protease pro-enzyme activation domain-containing protein [Dictyobacter aurantiacus]|uniref:Peptidase S53 domain-containing protein n=1 Tax=Dictyobacter aurantiacus TaxID=1936993 RepID=A0A401ZHI5_9CHLR|nr:protease pro-enzyme activation domain-containing protein [Dictyobacter aurantiacus]GCE06158.1 hypothetical protein KDAU_34870 [Dictyobacter aurantiacus]